MAEIIVRELETHLRYETASHVTAAKLTSPAAQPARMKWSDLHDPDLATRFKTALERLERLCYALYGSRPVSYSPFKSWEHRLHPRCLWQPEQWWATWCNMGTGANCNNYYWNFSEYAAFGDSYQWKVPRPSVPIRSRSGDWRLQVLDDARPHDRAYFPPMSVVRQDGSQVDYEGKQTFDPRGTGDFGGAPGGPDEVGADGSEHIAGEPVEVTYTAPAAYASIVTGVTLYWNGNAVAMVQAPAGIWKGTIPAQNHNTLVRWYVKATFQPPGTPAPPLVTRYEPGGAAAPTPEQQYTYTAFTHWNPYPHGMPELWSKCAKGTDRYEFTEDETIQPALINLARFILDYIGMSYDHSPKQRPGLPLCCLQMPIRFRWSGSAPWPHYVAGGKDSVTRVVPLHNRDQRTGDGNSGARKSWRGVEHLWASGDQNPKYGPGASWLSVPFRIPVERFEWDGPDECKIHWTGFDRGLLTGDVINRTHIEEVIAAVDYLVDNGLWTTQPIRTRVFTPTGDIALGLKCGQYKSDGIVYENLLGKCCAAIEDDQCIGFNAPSPRADGRTAWMDCWYNFPDGEHPSPPWLDDSQHPEWRKPPFGVCSIGVDRRRSCYWHPGGPDWEYTNIDHVYCNGGPFYSGTSCDYTGCGYMYCGWSYVPPSFEGPEQYGRGFSASNCGWSAYICGPRRAVGGPDALHGNDSVKARSKTTCPSAEPQSTGPSAGNRFGEAFSCALRWDTGEHGMDFETVTAVHYEGAAGDWLNASCPWTCDSEVDYDEPCVKDSYFPEIPGFPGHYQPNWSDLTQDPLYSCEFSCEYIDPDSSGSRSSGTCSCSLAGVNLCAPAVSGEGKIWVAVDLNVDGGAPYGPGMPTLHDYDPAPNPNLYPLGLRWTNCPCRTFTGPGSCEEAGGPL